jgi:hypothetical protein
MPSQESTVHGSASSHFIGPLTQVPPLQALVAEQRSWSSQAIPSAAAAEWRQAPVAGSQESAVHGLVSLQSFSGPLVQVPPRQALLTVHPSRSSHAIPSRAGA